MAFRPNQFLNAPTEVRGVHFALTPCNLEDEKTLHLDFANNQIPMGHLAETEVRDLHRYLTRTLAWFDQKKRGEQ